MIHRSARLALAASLTLGLVGALAVPAAADVNTAQQKVMVTKHNALRQSIAASESARLGQTVTIPDVTWDDSVAAVAQTWADHLLATDSFEHNKGRGDLGENIYWESGHGDPEKSTKLAFENWAAEQANYTWDSDSCSDVCGHYTQLVWAATTAIGCGMATDGTQAYWVCDYAPPGNMQGQRPYEPGGAATNPGTGTGTGTGTTDPAASLAPGTSPLPLASGAPADPMAAILTGHNTLRQTVAAAETARLGQQVLIPDLTWNPDAAAVAQGWADTMLSTGNFKHNKGRGELGENIYFEGGMDPATSADRAFASWAAEQTNYTWDTNTCADVCGHYTQAVWAATTSVGCGMATDGSSTYWVCDYAPPGNFNGQRPYEPGVVPGASVAPVASNIPVDQPVASAAPVDQPAPSAAPEGSPAA